MPAVLDGHSMFVVDLHYVVSLDRVDSVIPDHVEFLKRNYASGAFIASGRKAPRTGGIIISMRYCVRTRFSRWASPDIPLRSSFPQCSLIGSTAKGTSSLLRRKLFQPTLRHRVRASVLELHADKSDVELRRQRGRFRSGRFQQSAMT